MNGTSTTQFSPDEQLTRAMVITLLHRLSGDTGTYTCSFTDVPSDKYYCDPNRSQPATLHILGSNDLYSGKVVRGTIIEDIQYCKFEKDFDIVDNIDIDTDDNVLYSRTVSTESVLDEYSLLFIQASGEFAVTNAEGESFHFSRGEVTGSMEVYGFDFIVPGDNVPCELMFLVDPSSSYTCVVDEGAQLLAFHFLDSEDYLGGTADKSDSWAAATISSAEATEFQWIGGDIS